MIRVSLFKMGPGVVIQSTRSERARSALNAAVAVLSLRSSSELILTDKESRSFFLDGISDLSKDIIQYAG